MKRNIAVLIAALFAGCATQGPNEPAAAPSARPAAAAARPAPVARPPASSAANVAAAANAARAAASPQPAPSARSVYYAFDKSDLKAEDVKLIEANARYLREHPAIKVRIEGNADERGSREYNLALGQRRAETVLRTLKIEGVADERMEAVSYGEEKPVAQGHDEASWAKNRRADIVYK